MRATISHVFASGGGVFFLLLAFLPAAARAQTQTALAAGDPFADRGWHLELALHSGVEAWNYNNSREEMYGLSAGLTYGLADGLLLTARAPLYYVSQRGTDALLFGATIGVRGRVYRHRRLGVFLELDVGISESDVATPPRGTRFNYLALGGAGATLTVRDGLHLLASLRWAHVSNAGLAGRDRNPDIELIGPQVGVLLGF